MSKLRFPGATDMDWNRKDESQDFRFSIRNELPINRQNIEILWSRADWNFKKVWKWMVIEHAVFETIDFERPTNVNHVVPDINLHEEFSRSDREKCRHVFWTSSRKSCTGRWMCVCQNANIICIYGTVYCLYDWL